jgi:LPS-assembly lipoprotein
MRWRHLSVIGLALFITACGWQPLYGENPVSAPAAEQLSRIEVAPIADRIGQVVKNHLEDKLTPLGPSAAPLYVLEVRLSEEIEGFGFRRDESITRENLRLDADYRLLRSDNNQPVLVGKARSNMAYDVVRSDFANLSAREDAQKRTAEQLVQIIANRLSLHFLKAAAD